MDTAADAGLFLADLGILATSGADSGRVLLDSPDQDILSGHGVTREYAMTYEVAAFPTLGFGDSVIIEGTTYTVRAPPHAEDDGVFAVARLEIP